MRLRHWVHPVLAARMGYIGGSRAADLELDGLFVRIFKTELFCSFWSLSWIVLGRPGCL